MAVRRTRSSRRTATSPDPGSGGIPSTTSRSPQCEPGITRNGPLPRADIVLHHMPASTCRGPRARRLASRQIAEGNRTSGHVTLFSHRLSPTEDCISSLLTSLGTICLNTIARPTPGRPRAAGFHLVTNQVLLGLGHIRTSALLSSQFRSASYCCRTGYLTQ